MGNDQGPVQPSAMRRVHSTFSRWPVNRGLHGSHDAGSFRACSAARGYTLLELLFALAITLTMGAVAAPHLLAAVDDIRGAGAVRYVVTRLRQARMEAIVRSADVGWRFVAANSGYTYTPYVDGNGNGIRTQDIQGGADRAIGAVERLTDRLSGVDFGVVPGLPPVDAGGAPPGTDPIKLGLEQHPDIHHAGTSSSGSLYVRSRRNVQYVIRILGETGRVRR